ncbi:actin-domain-containing protein [Kalaharituber pfeilii]|nr:actin-domain-containing protein [Kalaharituber pfeilii]
MDTSNAPFPYRISSRSSSSFNPTAPLTQRAYAYSSTGSPLNQSEDPVVIEVGTRYLRAGFANEPAPRCEIPFNEDMWRRVGDKVVEAKRGGTMLAHKVSSVSAEADKLKKKSTRKSRGELWQYDLRRLDTGLVEDLVERVLREAYNKYLLVDSKTKKVVLPLPPLLPIGLIKTITNTIFSHFQPPTITYFSAPVLCTVSAGLRSAVVVDIGWHETVVTPIYDLRVIGGLVGGSGRTKRAGKILKKKAGEALEALLAEKGIEGKKIREDFLEELVSRVVWCESYEVRKQERELRQKPDKPAARDVPPQLLSSGSATKPVFSTTGSSTMLIPLSTTDSHKPLSINVPLYTLSLPIEHAFFNPAPLSADLSSLADDDEPDQDELPIPQLLYNSLLACPIDVRAACLSRIVIVGGPSNIPGLKKRIVDELRGLVEERGGWNSFKSGKKSRARKGGIVTVIDEPPPPPPPPKDDKHLPSTRTPSPPPPPLPPRPPKHEETPEQLPASPTSSVGPQAEEAKYLSIGTNPVRVRIYEELAQKENQKPNQPPGLIRGVKSLGTWVGASIVAGARVKGICEVEREKFLSAVASGGMGLPSNMM